MQREVGEAFGLHHRADLPRLELLLFDFLDVGLVDRFHLLRTALDELHHRVGLSLLVGDLGDEQDAVGVVRVVVLLVGQAVFVAGAHGFDAVGKAGGGGQEGVPPIGGQFGGSGQFGAELGQLIETAGKRRKEVAVELVEIDKAVAGFRELLRGLKFELRNRMTGLQALEQRKANEEARLLSVKRLSRAYQNQAQQGHVPRNEVARLKALELEISKELREIAEASLQLKQLLNTDPATVLVITDPLESGVDNYRLLSPARLLDEADRPDLKRVQLEEVYYQKRVDLERARSKPDVTLRAQYDRNGNTMLNFFGIGATVDLPLFNRNQGNIQHARINAQKAGVLVQQQALNVNTEIMQAYQGFRNALNFYDSIEENYDRSLDDLLNVYTQNFMNRNISMLEYLDFSDTYRNSKQILIDAKKEVRQQLEQLQYALGSEL